MELKNYFRSRVLWGLLSIVWVALYGTLMRYKIAFDFPFFDQKNLLHAHSHFAFSGWVSHFLFLGIFAIVAHHIDAAKHKIYKLLINLNMIAAYGMLIAFTVQGYKVFSISFSTLTIIIAVWFYIRLYKDVASQKLNLPAIPWAKAGALLHVIAAIGPLSLAYMMMSKNINSELYLASVYYYLHFQYNGWFFFGAAALAIHLLPHHNFNFKKYFKVFAITVIPTYVLSVLWAKPPMWLYILTVIATVAQLIAWVHLLINFLKKYKRTSTSFSLNRFLFYAAALSLTVKFILQTISVIPSLSQLVFGFRPIVIAYLHLVLLGIYSLFIIGYLVQKKSIQLNNLARTSIVIFFTGVLFNELFLGIQGIASFTYALVPYIKELLVVAACTLLAGATLLFASQLKKVDDSTLI